MANAAQRKVREFVAASGFATSLEAHVLDLASEVGELAKAWLEATGYGKRAVNDVRAMRDELGDALYSLLVVANQLEVDVDELLDTTLNKYAQRHRASPEPGLAGAGDLREISGR